MSVFSSFQIVFNRTVTLKEDKDKNWTPTQDIPSGIILPLICWGLIKNLGKLILADLSLLSSEEMNIASKCCWSAIRPDPQVINFFHSQLNWLCNFNCSLKLKCWKVKIFLSLKLSDAVFILLINVKMPTIVGILIFMSRIKFMLGWV